MILQKIVEDIIKKTSKNHNKPPEVILEAWLSQFKLLKYKFNCLDFLIIKFPGWGKYIPSQTKIKKIDYEAKKLRREAKYGKKNDNGTQNNQV